MSSFRPRFVETGQSRGLGLTRLCPECLLARLIGWHLGLVPAIEKLTVDGLILTYDLPEDEKEVRYVERRSDIAVLRYTTSGFMGLKLDSGLTQRDVPSEVFDTRCEALRHIDQGETE